MAFKHRRRNLTSLLLAIFAWTTHPLPAEVSDATVGEAPRLSLLNLREAVSGTARAIRSFRIEGMVCAFSRRGGLIILDDGESADLLELPSLPPDLHTGDRVTIEGTNCLLGRGPLALQLGTVPVIQIDGLHQPVTRSGIVFLQEGMRALRVEWFNGVGDTKLGLEFERADMPRQKVAPAALWHRSFGQGDFKSGLEYTSYVDTTYRSLPDFTKLKSKAAGIVPDFDLRVRSRPEMSALVFSGFIQVPRTGLYTFHLTSDDGARVFVIDTPVSCRVLKEDPARSFITNPPSRSLHAEGLDQWVVFEGTVNYASGSDDRLELELTENFHTTRVTVVDGTGLDPKALLHKSLKIAGLRRDSGIVVIDAAQIQMVSRGPDRAKVLTKVHEVRQLQRKDAAQRLSVEIQGVVTMVNPTSLVVQDETGGVFVHYLSTTPENTPHPGELWKINGYTGPGDFSPVLHVRAASYIGIGVLPKAVVPTQQQLASGSVDAEMVEIEGVVTAVVESELKLLTRSGKVSILGDSLYALPTTRMPDAERQAFVGSVVRLRGVYRAIWDSVTGNVQSAQLMLGNSTLSVDEPVAVDPFSAPLIRPSDLLLFTSHSTALKRMRVNGQLLYARPPEFFLFDGAKGFRVVAREAPVLMPGDQVEASGFSQLGGPSPELLEAQARKTGSAPLPAAVKVPYWNLPDPRLDSTLVEIEATLLSDTVRLDERALEMRAGNNRFVAFVPSDVSMPEDLAIDSLLKLTGVYISATADRTLSSSDPFELRLHDSGNIVVLKRGPWWTARRTIGMIAILSACLILAFSWVTLLRRTVSRRSRDLALEIEERERVERHRAMEQERSRMAKDLHDELGAGLTEAGMLSSLMRNPEVPMERKADYLDQLNELCCTLVTDLDEIVWAVNPRYDSVADLAGYFSLIAQRFLKLAGIICRLDINDAITTDPLDSRTRHGLFLAFKEVLNNIARHSGADEVHLTIKAAADGLMISLTDNGKGFDRSTLPPGCDGLRNMEERVQALGGTCIIESAPGKGTTVRFCEFKRLTQSGGLATTPHQADPAGIHPHS